MVLCEVIMCKFLVIVLGYLLLGIRCTRLDKNSLGTRPPPAAFQNEPEPYFTAPIENVTVPVGREAVLICPVSDLGNFRVGWMRADDQTVLSLHTRVVSHSSRYAVTNEPGATWKLHIRPVKEQDRGCYMCQINTPTMKNQLGCLDVHTPPNILDEGTSGDVTSREGEDVALSCRAEGNPPPRILWRREGGQSIIITNTSGEIGKGK